MEIIDIDSPTEDSFKYAILYSPHYYDVSHHIERMSKLKQFENNYNFSHSIPRELEIDYPNISLTVFNEDEDIIYSSNNFNLNKVNIVKMNDNECAAITPLKDHFIRSKELLQTFSQSELKDLRVQNIFKKYIK